MYVYIIYECINIYKIYVNIYLCICNIIIIIIGIFYLQVSSPKTWGSKPICAKELSKGIEVKSEMSQIK